MKQFDIFVIFFLLFGNVFTAASQGNVTQDSIFYYYQTLYAHMSKAAVRPGQKVKRGQLIGYVGSSGMSSGTLLHYEVIKNGQPVNPIYYFYIDITPEEYNSLLESSKKINQALS